jgi:hypothetical protein
LDRSIISGQARHLHHSTMLAAIAMDAFAFD